ncbi:MAG: hypothetical protein MUQ10_06280 [Anaerolineae bacterium]|nr:hypothetical protein [Anaerolineae bacterium]
MVGPQRVTEKQLVAGTAVVASPLPCRATSASPVATFPKSRLQQGLSAKRTHFEDLGPAPGPGLVTV